MLSKKTIKLNAKDGLRILDDTNYEVPLRKLSSGEQNLIILYFYLIFKTYKGTIVCLDEPENSMHVAWQKSMLEDFKKSLKNLEFNSFLLLIQLILLMMIGMIVLICIDL